VSRQAQPEPQVAVEVANDEPRDEPRDEQRDEQRKRWTLRLYVAGDSPKSRAARANLQRLCERYLQGEYTVQVIDLLENPALAKAHQIIAIPTLIRELPEPIKRVIGDLSDADKAMLTLDLRPGDLARE
jgi:circadian clock protein KaiB